MQYQYTTFYAAMIVVYFYALFIQTKLNENAHEHCYVATNIILTATKGINNFYQIIRKSRMQQKKMNEFMISRTP